MRTQQNKTFDHMNDSSLTIIALLAPKTFRQSHVRPRESEAMEYQQVSTGWLYSSPVPARDRVPALSCWKGHCTEDDLLSLDIFTRRNRDPENFAYIGPQIQSLRDTVLRHHGLLESYSEPCAEAYMAGHPDHPETFEPTVILDESTGQSQARYRSRIARSRHW